MSRSLKTSFLTIRTCPSLCRAAVLRDCQDQVGTTDNGMRDAPTWLYPNNFNSSPHSNIR
jgi:hypothetical protein